MTNIILTDPNADVIIIDPEREYSPLVKAMQGEVIWVGTLKGYSGTLAVVKHSPTLITAYGGLENVAVSQGSKIKSGQKIADLKGDTLRFEVRETGKCVDPLKYLNKR